MRNLCLISEKKITKNVFNVTSLNTLIALLISDVTYICLPWHQEAKVRAI